MGPTIIIICSIIGVILFILLTGIKIVNQSTVKIVERLGKYHKTMEAGISWIFPFLDKIKLVQARITVRDYTGKSLLRNTLRNYVDLKERVYDFPRQSVITKDNVILEINAMLYFQIMDPFKSVYEVEDLAMAIEKLTQTTLRNVIGEIELDQTLVSRDTINTKLREILDEATDKWGVKVNRVELQDIKPPHEIQKAMEKQMTAERERREMILRAEGEKQSRILQAQGERDKLIAEAEGRKQKQILEATGEAEAKIKVATAEAEAINLINKAISSSKLDPAQYLVAIKYVEALKKIAGQQGEKVIFMPFESSALLSSLGTIKELFKETKK